MEKSDKTSSHGRLSVSEEMKVTLRDDSNKLSELLKQGDTKLTDRIKSCLTFNLPGKNFPDYYRRSFYDQLTIVLGDAAPARFLLSMLEWADIEIIELLKAEIQAEDNVIAFLRELYGDFGYVFSRALRAAEQPLDWHRAVIRVEYDEDKDLRIRATIERNDGQKLALESSFPSFIRLQRRIIEQLSENIAELPDKDLETIGDLRQAINNWNVSEETETNQQ